VLALRSQVEALPQHPPELPEVGRWLRYSVDLAVGVIVPSEVGARKTPIVARGTELSRGMALCVDLSIKRDDTVEVEFQTPSKLLVTGIVRNQTNHCFGLRPSVAEIEVNCQVQEITVELVRLGFLGLSA